MPDDTPSTDQPMRVAVLPPMSSGVAADPDWMAGFATHAEACGYEGIVLVEHAVVIGGYESRYPYAGSGRMPLADDCPVPDPLDTLAYLAGVTTTLGLATGVLVLPDHHPVVLAKRLATIDRLSGGRLRMCVGVGWMREEIEACGGDFGRRGRFADEAIDAMRALWTAGPDGADFDGEFVRFQRAHSSPRPTQPRGVPIHIGGHSEAAARRAGRRGDGLQPLGVDQIEVTRLVGIMRAEADAAGRDADALEVTVGGSLARTDEAAVAEAAALGAARMVLSPSPSAELSQVCDELSAAAERLALVPPSPAPAPPREPLPRSDHP